MLLRRWCTGEARPGSGRFAGVSGRSGWGLGGAGPAGAGGGQVGQGAAAAEAQLGRGGGRIEGVCLDASCGLVVPAPGRRVESAAAVALFPVTASVSSVRVRAACREARR